VENLVQTVAIYALPVLFAITLHEAAHGYVARHFGDMTAFAQGRISLNPLRHIDLVGTIIVPIVILIASKVAGSGGILFGWAKPVPVNYSALRRPKQHMAWVAAAGPASNLLQAVLWGVASRVGMLWSGRGDAWMEVARQHGSGGVVEAALRHGHGASEFLVGMGAAGVLVNLVFMILNLVPIPPLDGGRILTSVLPGRAAWRFAKLEPYGLAILLVLLFTNYLGIVLNPLITESDALIRAFVFL
jgi:Zn-dependent protease